MVSPEFITALINWGPAGAVIVVVVLFLQFIAKRDKEWQDFFTGLRAADQTASARLTEAIEKLVSRIESLEGRFNVHEAAEMEVLRDLVTKLDKRPAAGRKTT